MYELDINRSGGKKGASFGGLEDVQQHKLFARLLESEVNLLVIANTCFFFACFLQIESIFYKLNQNTHTSIIIILK